MGAKKKELKEKTIHNIWQTDIMTGHDPSINMLCWYTGFHLINLTCMSSEIQVINTPHDD